MLCAAISSSLCDALNKLLSPGQTIATIQRNISQHCWPNIFTPRPNDRNISTQHIPTLLGATGCVSLATMLRGVATCYELKIELGPGATLLNILKRLRLRRAKRNNKPPLEQIVSVILEGLGKFVWFLHGRVFVNLRVT